MAEFKLTISRKDGKSVTKELKSPEADVLVGKKIGDKIQGDTIGFSGYEFELRGGSDKAGFPMRADIEGQSRKRILAGGGTGVSVDRKGKKIRKTVAGNTVSENNAQVNLFITKEGSEDFFTKKEEAAEGEAQEAAPSA